MLSNHYVYIYRLPDGSPVYVGKGCKWRDTEHLKAAQKINDGTYIGRVTRWHGYLSKRLLKGVVFTIDRVLENLTEDEAFYYELRLIEDLGRYAIDPGGVLMNVIEGGSIGSSSTDLKRIFADPELRAINKANSNATWTRPGMREQQAATMRTYYADPEVRQRCREKAIAAHARPEVQAKLAAAKARRTPEQEQQRRARLCATNAKPEVKERRSAARKEVLARHGMRERLSTVHKARWAAIKQQQKRARVRLDT